MSDRTLYKEILDHARPLKRRADLAPLIERCKDKRVVMLGESSHGTKEFYEWRDMISRELVEHHGFKFIAVEGDWPPCQKVHELVQQFDEGSSCEALSEFTRWPTWMWANAEMVELVEWMRTQHMGFHGLDVYSLFESAEVVIEHLKVLDPALARRAQQFYSCFEPYERDELRYGKALVKFPEGCQQQVLQVLQDLLQFKLAAKEESPYLIFDSIQNAHVVKNAERYYRAMIIGTEDSWNVRDQHMMDTLDMLLNHYGPDSKGIVWAHNTHIGDYRATDMLFRGEINIGGLAREKYGEEQVELVGFGTHHGEVIASRAWDGPMEVMEVPAAEKNSIEDIFHTLVSEVGHRDYLLTFDSSMSESALAEYRGHRAIGVVYHPYFEHRGNYVPTNLPRRYDSFIFLDETRALTPLTVAYDRRKFPETWPYTNLG